MTTFTTADRQDAQREPVAWIDKQELEDYFVSTSVTRLKQFANDVPLFTQQKSLTDDQILTISNTMPYANRFEFARAIERAHGIGE